MAGIDDYITIAGDLLQEYTIATIAAVVIVGYILYNYFTQKKNKSKMARQANASMSAPNRQPQQRPAPQPQPVQQPQPKPVQPEPAKDMKKLFSMPTDTESKKSNGIVDNMKSLSNDFASQSELMAQASERDFQKLKLELQEVTAKRQEIREAGLRLSELFDQHRARETHLVHQLKNLDEIIKKNKTQP